MSNKQRGNVDVPLGVLEDTLRSANMQFVRSRHELSVDHGTVKTRVTVRTLEPDDAPVESVITVKTLLGDGAERRFAHPYMAAGFNRRAAISALSIEQGRFCIGSRLTTHVGFDAWAVYYPLLALSVLDPMSAFQRGQIASDDEHASAWMGADFEQVERKMSEICYCNADAIGFTAEFGLRSGERSVLHGHKRTALLQLKSNQRHPSLGPGLLCLLNMPHAFEDEDKLDKKILELNQLELNGEDLPPHFGAWCRGGRKNNVAYVSFLPNPLHSVTGIALNMAVWAAQRAQLTDAVLQIEGIV